MTQQRRRLMFHWTTPRNFLALILFIIVVGLLEYAININLAANLETSSNIVLPVINVTISPYYHLLPAAVIVSLTSCFIHLTTHAATVPTRTQTPIRARRPRAKIRFRTFHQSWRKIAKAARRVRSRILRTPIIAYIQRRVIMVKALLKGATAVTVTFIIIVLLINIAAYPKLMPTAIANFFKWNQGFLDFIIATMRASEAVASAVPPIGALATSIHNGLITVAPAFRNALEGAGSTLAIGLVSLTPTEKYLITQNVSVWIVITITLLYTQYIKIRR